MIDYKTPSITVWTLILTNKSGIFTEGPGHSKEGDLVNDCTPPHRAVMGQPGSLPHNTVHPRFLHYTTVTRMTQRTSTQRQVFKLDRKYSDDERDKCKKLSASPCDALWLFDIAP